MEFHESPSIDNKEARLLISQLQQQVGNLGGIINGLQNQVNSLQPPTIPPQNPSASVNQIRNGDYSHAWSSWFDTGATDNSLYECYPWYSHPIYNRVPMTKGNTADGNTTLAFTSADVGVAAPGTITKADHGFVTGAAVYFTTTGTLPNPLVTGTGTTNIYYVIRVSDSVFNIASSFANAMAGTGITFTTAGSGSSTINYNYTLKESTNGLYSEAFSDWDWTTGSARLQGATDISTFLPGNNILPGQTYNFVACFVKQSQYVTCDESVRLFAGLYAKSNSAVWDWVAGAFTVTAQVFGTVATPTSRQYRIVTQTNRDFTIRSSVVTVANAPSDADFAGGARVVLSWARPLTYGVTQYDVYRLTGATYVLLQSVQNGTTYIDNNGFVSSAVGWPSATFSQLTAYTSTSRNIVDQLPYAGDPNSNGWATIPFSLKVPQSYDMSATDLTASYWLRFGFLGLDGNMDITVNDGQAVLGDAALTTTSSGQFRADQVGLTIEILKDDLTQLTTIASYTNANEIELTDVMPFEATDATVIISEGAEPHSVYVDLSHVDFVQGAAYAPNAEDISPDRGIPPVTPNGSTNTGGGGQPPLTPDGVGVCLLYEELVTPIDGKRIPISQLKLGDKLIDPRGGFNTVTEIKDNIGDVWLIVTENGAEVRATETKQIYISETDIKTLASLMINDKIVTVVNGEMVLSPIVLKEKIMPKAIVRQIGLHPRHAFLAGERENQVMVDNAKPIIGIVPIAT